MILSLSQYEKRESDIWQNPKKKQKKTSILFDDQLDQNKIVSWVKTAKVNRWYAQKETNFLSCVC